MGKEKMARAEISSNTSRSQHQGIVRSAGEAAKGSYLLSIITNPTSSSIDKTGALVQLLEEFEQLSRTMSAADFDLLKKALSRAMDRRSEVANWTRSFLPDDGLVNDDRIDGQFVRRIVVPEAGDEPSCMDLIRISLPAGRKCVISSEYTFESDNDARIEVVDAEQNSVIDSIALRRGHNRFATSNIETPEVNSAFDVILRVHHESTTKPLYWYQSLTSSEPLEELNSVDVLEEELAALKTSKSPTIFTPVTGEPLNMGDVERLNSLQNKFAGERIFVMGNGPSLNKTPLELLKNDYVFGLNRVSLLFDRVSWRPTFFTAFDVRVVPDNQDEFANVDIPYKFFSARYKELMGEKDNHFWYHTKGFYDGFESCFEPTVPYSGFGGGGTIAIMAIELAFFMGFREIYLIGTDVTYSVPKTVIQTGEDLFKDGVKLNLESTEDDDQNHFDPSYFGRGKKWHNPNVRDMKIGFARAASYIENRSGQLLNATVGGALDEVERIEFESLF